jgi:threonine synthase
MKNSRSTPDPVRFVSTRGEAEPCSFTQAMKRGLAPDGGLYLPDRYPLLPGEFWQELETCTLQQIAFKIAGPYFDSASEKKIIREVVESAINFDAPLKRLEDNFYVLELFHGPTLAFKDFGARFMARAFASLDTENDGDLTILVATSGDTGSAVAHGFHGVPGTKVCLLYPSGKVSPLQEQQMTTLGRNITALEVDGTFDDCQKLVKQAFSDSELCSRMNLSSANSINIARLLPQSFYYVYALAQLRKQFDEHADPVFSVPSGNFGNLTAGLIAMKMGMPVSRFLAATNSNDVVPRYLQTGTFSPQPSVKTLSNAMDVGNPSNFERITTLFEGSLEQMRERLWAAAFNDTQTRRCIRDTCSRTGYVLDPHTAVGLLAAAKFRDDTRSDAPLIILSTAHPAKFGSIVEKEIGRKIPLPGRLQACLEQEKKSIKISGNYSDFREFLIQ